MGFNSHGTISASYYDGESSGNPVGVHSKTTAELTSPTSAGGIYAGWSADHWDFGTSDQYPALKADSNGDDTATWQEFGYQLREPLRLAATPSGSQATLNWNAIATTHWTDAPSLAYALYYQDGAKIAGYDGSSLTYTTADLTAWQTYTYQVAALLNGAEAGRSNPVSVVVGQISGGGLIEVSSLAQLNAIRWDLNGDGMVDDAVNGAAYATAFPVAEGGLVGFDNLGSVRASYYNKDISGDGTHGKTTQELTAPTSYTGIYADWVLDIDGDGTKR